MSLRKNSYNRLKENDDDETSNSESYNKLQFQPSTTQDEIPWKGILLAFALTVIGFCLLLFTFTSYNLSKETSAEFPLPCLILGFIAFIPGSYHLWIAYHAYKRTPGFYFDDIPNFD